MKKNNIKKRVTIKKKKKTFLVLIRLIFRVYCKSHHKYREQRIKSHVGMVLVG